jgi:8-oxo-dGTP pyrophosphatase MutT (NUDIX family)
VCAFVTRERKVLLVQQRKGDAHYWLLPGGAVERGEALESAVRRELREECGFEVSPLHPPLGMVESISPDGGSARHVVHIIYAALLISESSSALRDPAIRSFDWFSAEEVADLIIHPPLQDVLQEWLPLFGRGQPRPWPAFSDLGVRWV